MRLSGLFRLLPLAPGEPSSAVQLVAAAAPWALVAVLSLALLLG